MPKLLLTRYPELLLVSRHRRTADTVTRKVQFFRAVPAVDMQGRPQHFDPAAVMAYLDSLPLPSGQRHWQHEDGAATCCWIDRRATHPRMRLANIRHAGLPMVEEKGVLADLSIAPAAGLAEPIHIVFFPDLVVGVEYNHYGPRISRLRDYLGARAASVCPPITFEPMLRSDALEQLRRLRSIRVFRLKIRPSFADQVREADASLAAALEASRAFSGGEFIEFIARAEPNARDSSLSGRVMEAAQVLYDRFRKDVAATDHVGAFEISGFDVVTGKVAKVDLLSDMLVSSQQIVAPKGRTRALDPASAFAAVERAYDEVRSQITTAGTIVP